MIDSTPIAANEVARAARPSWLVLLGPAFAVSVGYIDPGNWATDLAAGAFGFQLLWVVIVADVLAIILQIAVARLTVATGADIATLIARRWPRAARALWPIYQAATIATDVAELTGIALGAQLLFHLTLPESVLFSLAGVTLLFSLGARSSKRLEVALTGIVALIALAYVYQIHQLHPAPRAILTGALIPRIPGPGALVVIVGIIGATVMPHNLFLHSALIAKSCQGLPRPERERRGRFYLNETLVALNLAALINGGILIVGAALRGADGSLDHAFHQLIPLAGGGAALVFGAALLLSGLAASATATLSGDYIFTAFSPIAVPTFVRRAFTLAPAAIMLIAGIDPMLLLTWSQVALALILPSVIVPLLILTARTRFVGPRAAARRALAVHIAAASICIGFDGLLIVQCLL